MKRLDSAAIPILPIVAFFLHKGAHQALEAAVLAPMRTVQDPEIAQFVQTLNEGGSPLHYAHTPSVSQLI